MAGTYHVALVLPSGKITPASARAHDTILRCHMNAAFRSQLGRRIDAAERGARRDLSCAPSARAPLETATGAPASGTAPSREPEKPFAVKLRSDSIPMILRDRWKMVFLKVMPVAVQAVQIDIFTALSRLIV
jgi:hypothetical protein